MRKVEIGRGW
jgi:hypothetical protein